MRRYRLPTIALALLSVAGVCSEEAPRRRSRDIEGDVSAYLQATYGEPFVVDRIRTRSNEASGFVDSHGFDAHPTGDPELTFTGLARYDTDPPRFSDRYRCAQVSRWLPTELAAAVDAPFRIRHAHLECGDGLPPRPERGAPLPAGTHRLRLDAEVFDDGAIDDVATEVRALLDERADALGVQLEGHLAIFSAALWPHTERVGVPAQRDPLAEDWSWMERARAPLEGGEAQTWVHRTDLERAVEATVRERAGEGAQVRVWAVGLDHRSPMSGRARIDLRVSAPELDEEAMRAITEAVWRAHTGHLLRVRGGGGDEYVCQGPPTRCRPAPGPLIPPKWEG